MTGALRLDLHVHSSYSPDGRASLPELLARAAATGLDGFALTDHNSVAGHATLREIAPKFPQLRLLPGVEVSTREGHLLALGVARAPPPRRPIAETIDWVRGQGGEPVLAHPFRWVHGVGRSVALSAPVGAIEVVNGHTSAARNARARSIAAARSLGGTGGSDAHRSDELGRAVTQFPLGVGSIDDLLGAIRQGRTVGEGLSLDRAGQLRSAFRSAFLRVARGFRSV
jgi:predicted metal-dependent phosphoesterase TrpH